MVEDGIVHARHCHQRLWTGRLGAQPRWFGLLVGEVTAQLDLQLCVAAELAMWGRVRAGVQPGAA
eukprot:2987415-Pyramimonas_sp.AAC.1